MVTDAELLGRYAKDRSESAFTELVERHINLVYAAALREMQGDTSFAEEVTQAVFAEAAHKAAALARHPAFVGWLYTSVRYTAANVRRSEQRRRRREQGAHPMNEMNPSGLDDDLWQQLRPVLDDAMHELSETDRAVVALRFFEGRSFKEVGLALNLNENAARMRAERALDKLKFSLNKRGVTSTSTSLAAALGVSAVVCAPPGLAATVATVAVAGAAASTSAGGLTILKIMSMSKLQMAALSAVLVAGIGTPIWQQSRLNRLASRNQALEAQTAEIPSLREEVARLHQLKVDQAELERLRAVENEVVKLRSKANQGSHAQAEVAQLRSDLARQKSSASRQSNPFGGAMSGMMKGYMEQMLVGKLNKMKEKLNLTPEQEQAIRDLYLKQTDAQAEMAQKMFSGNLTKEEMTQAQQAAGGDPEKQIKALLTPEQQAAYKEYQQEEAVANARLAATAEALQMQNALSLSPEQQDKVYGVLYDQYARQLSPDAAGSFPTNANPATAMQYQLDQKLNALQEVLTPAQLDSYKQFQAAQLKMIQGFLPGAKDDPPLPPSPVPEAPPSNNR